MGNKALNDKLQLAASVGVIIGLIMVAFELRQNSEIARNDVYVSLIETWGTVTTLEIESDISVVFDKSMKSPESMTNAELMKLGSWLQSYVQIWQLQVQMDMGGSFDVEYEIRAEAYYLFGNHASRAWYVENRYWMPQQITTIIDDYIANNPVGSDAKYFDSIRERIRTSVAEIEAQMP